MKLVSNNFCVFIVGKWVELKCLLGDLQKFKFARSFDNCFLYFIL